MNPECQCEKRVYDPETMEDICQTCGRAYVAKVYPANPFEPHFRSKKETRMAERDCYGVKVPAKYKESLQNAELLLEREHVHEFRTMRQLERLTLSVGEQLGLSTRIMSRAHDLVKKCNQNKIGFKKHDRVRAIAAVCLYLATKEMGVPRNFKQYASAAGIDHKTFHRFQMRVETMMGTPRSTGPQDYRIAISHICNVLNLGKIEHKALELFDKTGTKISMGRKHDALAAGYVYKACEIAEDDIYLMQKEIAQAAGVSSVSLRKSAKLIQRELDSTRNAPDKL